MSDSTDIPEASPGTPASYPPPPAMAGPAQPSPAQAPPPYGAPPQYRGPQAAPGAAPYAAPAYRPYDTAPKTNVLAIISMIASIAGAIWILPIIGSLAGAIMGHLSLKQIATTGEKGRGMAMTGVIVGWVGLGLAVVGIGFFVFFVILAAANDSMYR